MRKPDDADDVFQSYPGHPLTAGTDSPSNSKAKGKDHARKGTSVLSKNDTEA